MNAGPFTGELASLRRIWSLLGDHRRATLVAVSFRVLQLMALGIGFWGALDVVTGMAAGRQMTSAWAAEITVIMGFSLLGQLLFSYLSVQRAWDTSFQVGCQLRLRLLEHLKSLPMGFHLSRHNGDTATVLTTDVTMIESFLSDALAKIVQAITLPATIIGVMAWQDVGLAMALATSLLLALPVAMLISRKLSGVAAQRQEVQAQAGGVMIEYLQGIRVIRAFNRMVEGEEMFARALEQFRDISIRMVLLLALPMVSFAAIVMLAVPVASGAVAMRFQDTPTGLLITALMLVFAIAGPLVNLATVMERIRIADASLKRMDRVLEAKPLLQATGTPAEPVSHGIRFENVSFGYDPVAPVLRDVSFDAAPGSMTAIVGASGSGKSTILNLLARFWDVDQGRIEIGGCDLRHLTPQCLGALVSVVFQDVYLFSGSIRDNIAVGCPSATQNEIESAARAAQAHEFIIALPDGYDSATGEGGVLLSGGERQRISIARAILKDAPVVLLDEATAALDPSNDRAIQDALAHLVRDKTLIVVAHKLTTIEAASQILVLRDGQIAERGTHTELAAANGLYARMLSRKTRALGWRISSRKEDAENA